MIECCDLTLSYDQQPVLKQITLTLGKPGITALIGPNGAGKSTLLSAIARLVKPDSGTVLLDGEPVVGNQTLAKHLAILRQDNHMEARLSVYDLVCFGRYPHSGGRLTDEDLQKVAQAIDYLDLQPLQDRYLDELSGGQRQRAFIAMILAQDTEYILLDEPLNNLDMKHAVSIMKLMQQAARDMHKKIIIVLHDINFASVYADQIIAMKDGQVAYQGTPEEMITEPVMLDLYDLPMQIQQINDKPIAVYHL
ncbi:iron ABC transporter ATP-binding protein [Salinibius halmophilus]|uniref:iron ABC transporter ATP-binding protein n=1 Tax=Salinibius halmophilus TaxID=1853216 RepID=UPI000E66707D|nr:ATP-binding cassette domain-containing protein [Salinibius halmophilus]